MATVSTSATQAASDAKRAQDDVANLRTVMETADVRRFADELQRIRVQLDETRAQLARLNAEVERLTNTTPTLR
jgi:hypothetical protein